MDLVFSLDSVITAVGMASELWVMMAAVILAIIVMMIAAGVVAAFANRHPTVKMLVQYVRAVDRHDANRRRLRHACAEGIHLCRDRLLGSDRSAEQVAARRHRRQHSAIAARPDT